MPTVLPEFKAAGQQVDQHHIKHRSGDEPLKCDIISVVELTARAQNIDDRHRTSDDSAMQIEDDFIGEGGKGSPECTREHYPAQTLKVRHAACLGGFDLTERYRFNGASENFSRIGGGAECEGNERTPPGFAEKRPQK